MFLTAEDVCLQEKQWLISNTFWTLHPEKYAHWHIREESGGGNLQIQERSCILTGYYNCYSVKLRLRIRSDENIFMKTITHAALALEQLWSFEGVIHLLHMCTKLNGSKQSQENTFLIPKFVFPVCGTEGSTAGFREQSIQDRG